MHYKSNLLYKILNFIFWLIGVLTITLYFKSIVNDVIFLIFYLIFSVLYIFMLILSKEHKQNVSSLLYVDRELYNIIYKKYLLYKKYQGQLSFDEECEFEKKLENDFPYDDYEFKKEYEKQFLIKK